MLFTKFIACILVAALGHAKASFLFNWGGSPCGLSATPPSSSIVAPVTGKHPPAVSADSSVKASDKTTAITQGSVIRAKSPTMNFMYFGNRVLQFVRDERNLPGIFAIAMGVFVTYIASITEFCKGVPLGSMIKPIVESAPTRNIALLETFIQWLAHTSFAFLMPWYDFYYLKADQEGSPRYDRSILVVLVTFLVIPKCTEHILLSLNKAIAAT